MRTRTPTSEPTIAPSWGSLDAGGGSVVGGTVTVGESVKPIGVGVGVGISCTVDDNRFDELVRIGAIITLVTGELYRVVSKDDIIRTGTEVIFEVTAGGGGDEVTSLGMVIVVSLNLASAM